MLVEVPDKGSSVKDTRWQQSVTTELNLRHDRSGWRRVYDMWTYVSALVVSAPQDPSTRYYKGQKVRVKQGGNYIYFYIIGVSTTQITLFGPTNLTNVPIDNLWVSNLSSPDGFPTSMNWTPSVTGTNLTSYTPEFSRLAIRDGWVDLALYGVTVHSAGAASISIILPISFTYGFGWPACGVASTNGFSAIARAMFVGVATISVSPISDTFNTWQAGNGSISIAAHYPLA
jgi:hypothetical protein